MPDSSDNRGFQLNRRQLLALGSTALVPGLVARHAGASAAVGQAAPRSTLIRNATVVTMDPELGDIPGGGVLIRDGKIAEVGAELTARADETIDAHGAILTPGFVDGHRHLWQVLMRGQGPEWTFNEYIKEGLYRRGVSFEPEHMLLAGYAGGLEALNAGVTTVVDHCHNLLTPEHAEAAVEGMLKSGVGGFFCYGFRQPPKHRPGDTITVEEIGKAYMDREEWRHTHAKTIKAKYFTDEASNLQFGIAPSYLETMAPYMPDEAKKEMLAAREADVRLVTIHIHNFGEFRLVPFLEESGLLDQTVHFSHGNGIKSEEFEILRRRGVGVTGTPETETGEFPSFGKARAAGVPVGLGMDTVNAVGSDMFTPMRLTFYLQRSHEVELAHEKGIERVHTAGTRDLLDATTLGAAEALGLDSRLGSITPGKQADLVLFDNGALNLSPATDPAATVVFQANVGDIKSVWVAGKRVKRDGKLVGIDGPAIARDLTAAADRILEQADRVNIKGDVRI